MANENHLRILLQGVSTWNQWRQENPTVRPDLTGADVTGLLYGLPGLVEAVVGTVAELRGCDFTAADLRGANLAGIDLRESMLAHADLSRANLSSATLFGLDLSTAVLRQADLQSADLRETSLRRANLWGAHLLLAKLGGADLTEAKLDCSTLVDANLEGANLSGCSIYGISAWRLTTDGKTKQTDLVIHSPFEAIVRVDSLEMAQFVYLLLNNDRLRDVIDTIASKAVLILGRFTPERKAVLEVVRQALRERGYVPMVFEFERPTAKDLTETIQTLAGMSLFIVADITKPKSAPLELQATVPDYMTPFVPIIQEGEEPFSMFQGLKNKYDWVLELLVYDSPENLVAALEPAVIVPALQKHRELTLRKAEAIASRHVRDYVSGLTPRGAV